MPIAAPSATVMLLRESGDPFQVLMVERNSRGMFGSVFVFPGGRVEQQDVPEGLDLDGDDAHRVAAIRELAEETGILLTTEGAVPWASASLEHLATDALELVSRWVTPEFAPSRYDTRFYLATCDAEPDVVIDEKELVGHLWVTPGEALGRNERGDAPMVLPTVAHMRWLSRRTSISDAFESARGADARTLIKPVRVEDGSLLPICLPADPT